MHSLNAIQDWPVDHAAATVVGPDGPIGVAGEPDRVFALASVTKPLVAYAVLVAVEEGALELDMPAGPPGATVRHLLAHASGLAFGEHRVQAAPGEKRIYSSAGFEVLADLVETETAIAFPEYLRDAVFAPLGMGSSELTGPAGHGARSSTADLARFAAELLRPTLVSEHTVRDAVTVQYPGLSGLLPGYGTQRPNDWGLGFEIKGDKSPHWTGRANSSATYGHFGQSGTFLWVDPARELSCVALADRDFGDWAKDAWPALSDAVLAEIA
ncbi:beta-lactamase family protein [Rhodococcus spelaei]|uniref:Beta-lactamase family protein n=1 Tax=Rhodococcus spelaei TaxID=2546320 RepID=A0A541BME3_9NOCA|nr:serine hydrolase domain-containing protein [Rhodococcus spelaei]TQF73495.1 beta-lactamase family protein [Rhodococcus spelaei]